MRLWAGLVLIVWEAWAQAQTAIFPPPQLARIQQGLRDIYTLRFSKAAADFEAMIRETPDDPAGYAYLAMTYWLAELADKQELSIDRFAASDFFAETPKYTPVVDPKAEERFRTITEQAIQKARDRLAKNAGDRQALFLLGMAYQNLASFEASLKRRWWAAFRAGTKTYKYHEELLRRDPNFHDARLTVGAYNYVAASLPRSVKWFAILLGYLGSKERGKQDLALAAEKAMLTADDARVTLSLIYVRERNYKKAAEYLGQLVARYPENHLIRLDLAGVTLLMRQPERAIAIYQEVLKRSPAIEKAIVYTRIGVALREKDDHPNSAKWLSQAIAEPRTSERSVIVARLELGKTLDLLGQRQAALKQYQMVATAADVAGSRKEAAGLLDHPYRGNRKSSN